MMTYLKSRLLQRAAFAGLTAVMLGMTPAAQAESFKQALVNAYRSNPTLQGDRARQRSTDELVPSAKSGWRPRIEASGDVSRNYANPEGGPERDWTSSSVDIQLTQPLFRGFKTVEGVAEARENVKAGRQQLLAVEQQVLLDAATAYMNVLRDTAVVNLRKNNISVLEEQLRQTRDRFQVGEVTRTDVAQAEASLAQSRSEFFSAQANLRASVASFRQYVGIEPKNLAPAKSVEGLLPKQLNAAVDVSQVEHPAIGSALHNVDVAAYAVKVAEAALYPTVQVNGAVNRQLDSQGLTGQKLFTASVTGQINVPIYQGGAEYATIRQAKEQLGQARLSADLARDQVRALIVTNWGQLETAKAQLISGQANVTAAEIALNGVREEAKVGQRTTFDVLTAQQTLLNARVALVTAQRDRVVASYAVLSAMGHLSADRLNLTAQLYDPTVHFDQVKSKLIGTGTPDGR